MRAAALAAAAVALAVWLMVAGRWEAPAERAIWRVAVGSSGRCLAAGTRQGEITVWEGADVRRLEFRRGTLNDLQFSPDESLLAVAARDLGLWNPGGTSPCRLLRADGRNYGSVRFSRDGGEVLTTTGPGTIEAIDAVSGALRWRGCCTSVYGEAAYTPEGGAVVHAGHWPGRWERGGEGPQARFTAVRQFHAFGPIAFLDGLVLMGSQDGRAYGWELAGGRPAASSSAGRTSVETLAVCPGGWAAMAGRGEEVRLWNPLTGEERRLAGARPSSNIVAAADGTIVFGTAEGRVERRRLDTGERQRVWLP